MCPVDNSFSRGKLRVFFSIVVASKKKRSNAFPRFSSTPPFFFFLFFPFFPYHGSHHVQLALKRKCFYTSRSIDPSHLPLQTLYTIPKNMLEETELQLLEKKKRNLNSEISSSRYIFRIIFFFYRAKNQTARNYNDSRKRSISIDVPFLKFLLSRATGRRRLKGEGAQSEQN